MRFFYTCNECGRDFDIRPDLMVCPYCSKKQEKNKPLRGILDVGFDGKLKKQFDIYDLLPIKKEYFPSIPVGNTPLWKPVILRKKLAFPNLYLKDDTLNPTGSLKDRASYLIAAFALKHGIKNVVVASTGNAASSMAGVGAAAGIKVTIFMPKTAPRAKMVQSLQYGAEVIQVDGDYNRAYDLSLEYIKNKGGLNRNTAYNPLTIEGKKTVAIEIYQQLNKAPDFVFVPVGDGVILGGVYKGFRDLLKLGLIDKIPVIYAVQAEGSSAIYRAFKKGEFNQPKESMTIADSISVDVPRNGYYVLKLLKKYNGRCITVPDEDILKAQKELASSAGLFSEPAASASLAGFLKVKNEIKKDSTVVLLITGNGLKDIDAAMRGLRLFDKLNR